MNQLEITELSVTAAIVGIIWIIQLLHYPSFRFYQPENFQEAMKNHQDRISIVIVPLMLSEISLAAFGAFFRMNAYTWSLLGIVGAIWIITFTVQVPLHDKLLKEGFNLERINSLVKSNWSRTILWTIKLSLILMKFI